MMVNDTRICEEGNSWISLERPPSEMLCVDNEAIVGIIRRPVSMEALETLVQLFKGCGKKLQTSAGWTVNGWLLFERFGKWDQCNALMQGIYDICGNEGECVDVSSMADGLTCLSSRKSSFVPRDCSKSVSSPSPKLLKSLSSSAAQQGMCLKPNAFIDIVVKLVCHKCAAEYNLDRVEDLL